MSQNISAPFSFPSSGSWDGNAGNWSTFLIRVGTPPQEFKVLPSTSSHQTWIPVPAGCTSTDPPDCGSLRGALPFRGKSSNGFLSNESSTWIENGIYDLGLAGHDNLTGNGDYGYDTVGLAPSNSTGLSLPHQVVAGIATKDIYLGQFGLDPRASNFTTYDDPIPSYLKELLDSHLIPSLSYGYTAGAKYRLKGGVFGSLTLGGYDSSRLIPSNFTIPFAPDGSRGLSVGLQSITASNTLQGSVVPYSDGGFFLIDSSVPDIWLPEPTCSVFEEAFGLTFDNNTSLFTVSDASHERLLQSNPSVVFKMGIQPIHGPTVNISLPYEAFDLQASSPYYPNMTRYFPLRRAVNETQYTLGRTLLQEAYIIIDYERSNFSVNQAVFRDPNPEVIVTIPPETQSTSGTPSPHHHLIPGAIAGIAVGAIAFVFTLIAIMIFLVRRNKKAKRVPAPTLPTELEDPQMRDTNGYAGSPRLLIQELDPKAEVPKAPQELNAVRPRLELRGSSVVSELPASVVGDEKDLDASESSSPAKPEANRSILRKVSTNK